MISLSSSDAQRLDFARSQIYLPEGYALVRAVSVRQNEQEATLFRYEKESIIDNGEHVSLVVQHDPLMLLGYLWMDRQFANEALPSREETTQIARDFFQQIDPSWNQTLNNLWIHRHDETLLLNDQEKIPIVGMKFKCYRESHDDFAWVIVGYNREIIAFERDTRWQHVRLTEKWLHDAWTSLQPL